MITVFSSSSTLFSVSLKKKLFIFIVIIMATSQLLLRYSSAYRPLGLGLLSSGLLLTNRAKCENTTKFSTEVCATVPKELAANPLLQKEGLPKFRQIKPADVVPAIEFDMNQLKKNFEGKLSAHLTFPFVPSFISLSLLSLYLYL